MRSALACLAVGLLVALPAVAGAADITGDYMEARTCDIYTGPCFANAEVGLTGSDAVMAWSMDQGHFDGVDLSGLKVVLAVRASDTLGFGGGVVCHPDPIKSAIYVDAAATAEQRAALVAFVKHHAARVAGDVVRVEDVAIDMTIDHVDHVGKLNAGSVANITTRKMAAGDCVCTNEVVFYPPLAKVDNSVPAYSLECKFTGRGLGSRWSQPNSRTAFLATFAY